MKRKKVKHPRLHVWDKTMFLAQRCLIRGCKMTRCAWKAQDITRNRIVIQKGHQCRSARLPDGVYCRDHRRHMNETSGPIRQPIPYIRFVHAGRDT